MNDKSCYLIQVGHKSFFKGPDFHKTSGDYKVGTHLFETVDSGRSKPFLLEIQEREDFKDMQI